MCHSRRGWRNTEQNLRQTGKACNGACGHLTEKVQVRVQWRYDSDERKQVLYPTAPALTGNWCYCHQALLPLDLRNMHERRGATPMPWRILKDSSVMKGCPPSIVWSSRVNALQCRKASRHNLRTRTIWTQTPTPPPRAIYLPLTDQPRSAQEQHWTGLWLECPAQPSVLQICK